MLSQENLESVIAPIADYLHNVCGVKEFTVNPDGSINVIRIRGKANGDVMLFKSQETELAVRFERVDGNFYCCYSKLNSMKNFPRFVGGNLDISFTDIHSLEGMPDYIDKDFVCTGCGFDEKDIPSTTKIIGKVYC